MSPSVPPLPAESYTVKPSINDDEPAAHELGTPSLPESDTTPTNLTINGMLASDKSLIIPAF